MWDLILVVGLLALLHFALGKYPRPLPASKDRRRELLEVLVLWALLVFATTIALFVIPEGEIVNPSFGGQLIGNLLLSPFWVVIPLYLVLRVSGWTWRELGFRAPRSAVVTAFALALFGYVGLEPLFSGSDREPIAPGFLLLAVYQPVFTEELFFSGIIQGKLERALGQVRAWLWSGILFGLAHVSVNLFGAQWFDHGQDLGNAVGLLIMQILAGWIYGLIYMKTRSLLPGTAAHFMTDWRLGSLVMLLMA